MDLVDYDMDFSDTEETNAIPASSQLTGSQWVARAHEAQLASDTASVQWQNSQTTIPALNALISQASKPVPRPAKKSSVEIHDLPPVPLFSESASTSRSASASTSRKASTSTARPRARGPRKSTGSLITERTAPALPEGPAGFLSMLKNVSEQVDSNAREKMRHKEKRGDKDVQRHRQSLDPALIRPRKRQVQGEDRSSRARGKVNEVDFGLQSRERGSEQFELVDQTNLEHESHTPRYLGQSATTLDRSLTSVTSTPTRDTFGMDVDPPAVPHIDTTGDWDTSRAQSSAVDASDSSLSASTPTTPTIAPPRSQTATTHEPSLSPVIRGRSSTFTRATSAPQARSITSESPNADISTTSAPSSQMSRIASHHHSQITRTLSQNSELPLPLLKRNAPRPPPPPPAPAPSPPHPVIPAQPVPLAPPRASQRPPPLGMRRAATTSYGLTPSQTLPTRQRPFKPPLARPRPHPAPTSKEACAESHAKAAPGRLPTPNPSPPAPPATARPRRDPSPPPPAEADSSYGELSFDIDLLDAEMQKYD